MAQVGLCEADLADQDARVPLAIYKEIVRRAKLATGDPAFVLNHAIDTQLEDISVVGLIVHTSKSMADSMEQLNRYSRLMVEVDVMETGERFSIQPGPEGVWIVDNRPDPNSFPELTEAAFGRFESEFRREFPDRPFARAIEVTHPAPSYADDYERILRCPVTFGATRNALLIAPEWLVQEFDEHSDYVFGIFAEKADALLAELETSGTLRARIEALLMPVLHKGEVSVESIAGALGMSRQTLYRRLKEEGVTFAGILNDLRCRMASDYLAARKVSVNETAYLVGFSEASSFVRAFKRWTGQTPAEYRAAAG
ncbi:AraC family transcriptional regulator [Sinisalibacter aestuarii]|uniref:AraC family transcriptional regulator n=2 Tax=Sinisalibacter aestuarii TaxID=2949426 RepID=A0ABQ5LQ57_9RHOB|nr:AraC family transcriptional regulator [Sinisalibacter aestuarii]